MPLEKLYPKKFDVVLQFEFMFVYKAGNQYSLVHREHCRPLSKPPRYITVTHHKTSPQGPLAALLPEVGTVTLEANTAQGIP